MDESERGMVAQASVSMDPAHKALFYGVMKKNIGLTTLISLIIPGGGQIYLAHYLKGVLILIFSWLIIPWLYGIYDAYNTASKYNKELYMLIFPKPVDVTTMPVQIQEQKKDL